nr:manganese efflux pump [Campylobacter volucris]
MYIDILSLKLKLKHYLIVGLYFGGFQALMPDIGYILGLKIGNKFGTYLKNKAEFIGGAILIFLAVKILLEHLYF